MRLIVQTKCSREEDTATVTIKYIDNYGKIAADDVFSYLNDSDYHFVTKKRII